MKKRILVLLSVAALMVMLATSVAPAFALNDAYNCRLSNKFTTEVVYSPGSVFDRNGDGYFCILRYPQSGKAVDNHPKLIE